MGYWIGVALHVLIASMVYVGQTNAEHQIAGRVVDASGAVLPGVQVQVTGFPSDDSRGRQGPPATTRQFNSVRAVG